MSTPKKVFGFLFILLLMLSILHDLSKDTIQPAKTSNKITEEMNILTIKVKPGDTVLSITEEINHFKTLEIVKVIEDFKYLNPGIDHQLLEPNQSYYFPLYID
ncbi:hypothetical protein [Oceanobacillus sp. CAU 1775]